MSQTEIICACVLGVLGLLLIVFLCCFVAYLKYELRHEKNNQIERISNALFDIVDSLDKLHDDLFSLTTISDDIDRIEVHQDSFYACAVELGNKILDEIKKVGE